MKQQTVEKWQRILEMQRNYPGTINDFCRSIHMSVKTFYNGRRAFYLHQEQNDPVAILPVQTEPDPMISFVVNGIPIQVDPTLDPDSLALIIRSFMAS